MHACLIPIYAITILEIYFIFNYESRLTTSYLNIVLGDIGHLPEFLEATNPVYFLFVIIFLLVFIYALRQVKKLPLHNLKKLAIIPVIILLGIYIPKIAKEVPPKTVLTAINEIAFYDQSVPFGILSKLGNVISIIKKNRVAQLARSDFTFNAQKISSSNREIHILVLGESSRPDHWQFSGYNRNTNPLLSEEKNLIFFDDVTSEISLTSISVPLIITRHAVGVDMKKIDYQFKEKSIVSAFSEAGYKTFWFSTVELDSTLGDITNYSLEADDVMFYEWEYDGALIKNVTQAINNNQDENIFVVLHTQGSHFLYPKRYPPEFNVFTDSKNTDKKQNNLNEYDNTILYTDYFLSEIIKLLKQENTVSSLTYISDHGENLYDDDRDLYWHVHNNEYDIPTTLFFWTSQRYNIERKSVVSYLRVNSKNAAVNTSSIFPTLTDLAGLSVPGTDLSRSLANPLFKPYPRMFIRNEKIINFDEWLSSNSITVPSNE